MKQRVAAASAMLWLTWLLGASVALVETATVPRLPSGPSPDQYTPLPRNLDTRRQDWINPQPFGMPIPNHVEESGHRKTKEDDGRSDSSGSPMHAWWLPNAFHSGAIMRGEKDSKGNYFRSDDSGNQAARKYGRVEWANEKIAFDALTSTELDDTDNNEAGWINDRQEQYADVRRDEFGIDNTFEDQGPGSVEVYKLDLNKNKGILQPGSAGSLYFRSKSKMPKKVSLDSGQVLLKDTGSVEPYSSRFASSQSFRDRLFGVGGVPELQVGCEGIEASQRQRRSSQTEVIRKDKKDGLDSKSPLVSFELDYYYSDELSDEILDEDLLNGMLPQVTTTTVAPPKKASRGDMDPILGAFGERKKRPDRLPTRGDLGTANNDEPTKQEHSRKVRDIGPKSSVRDSNRDEDAGSFATMGRKLLSLGDAEDELRHRRPTSDSTQQLHESERHQRLAAGEGANRGESLQGRIHKRDQLGRSGGYGTESRRGSWNLANNGYLPPPQRYPQWNGQYGRDGSGFTAASQVPTSNAVRCDQRSDPWSDACRYEAETQREEARYREKVGRRQEQIEAENRRNMNEPRGRVTAWNQRRNEISTEQQRQIDAYVANFRARGEDQSRSPNDVQRPNHEGQRFREQARPRGQIQRLAVTPIVSSPNSIDRRLDLKSIPVSAQIIIDPSPISFGSRFNDNVDYQGINPNGNGIKLTTFPAPATVRPPMRGPSACTWAISNCCAASKRRPNCFESMGCPGAFWDNDPCSLRKTEAALNEILKYYGA